MTVKHGVVPSCHVRVLACSLRGSQMIDRFLYWGDHRNQKSGEIRGSCQPPLGRSKNASYATNLVPRVLKQHSRPQSARSF